MKAVFNIVCKQLIQTKNQSFAKKIQELKIIRCLNIMTKIQMASMLFLYINLVYWLMGNLHYRPNFNPGKMNEIFYYSSKEHVKISRIAKFGGEKL